MSLTDDLIEGKFYYTDKGIEICHWCEVNGKRELITPKVNISCQVPDYEHWEATKEDVSYFQGIAIRQKREFEKMKEEFNETIRSYEKNKRILRNLLKECKPYIKKDFEHIRANGWKQEGVFNELYDLLTRINTAIGESEE